MTAPSAAEPTSRLYLAFSTTPMTSAQANPYAFTDTVGVLEIASGQVLSDALEADIDYDSISNYPKLNWQLILRGIRIMFRKSRVCRFGMCFWGAVLEGGFFFIQPRWH